MDPCLFSLSSPNGVLHGLIGVHVDDGLCCGDSVFSEALSKLETTFPFGSKREGDFVFTGIRIRQDSESHIHLDQTEYIKGIEPISIDRARRKKESELVLESERQGLRGLIGFLQYAASNSRPDISAKLSFLQSRINCATIHDLLEANRLLGEAKKDADVTITIKSIPVESVRLVSYSDASFVCNSRKEAESKGRYGVGCARRCMPTEKRPGKSLGMVLSKDRPSCS
jgi:hypothetical protein